MTKHYFVILLLPPLPFDVAKSMARRRGQGQSECRGRCAPDVHSAGFPALSSAKELAEVKVVPKALPIAWPLLSTAETAEQN